MIDLSKLEIAVYRNAIGGKLSKYKETDTNINCIGLTFSNERCNNLGENWNEIEIGDIVNIKNGFTPKRDNPIYWENGDIPWFTVDDLHEQGYQIFKTTQHITNEAVKGSEKRLNKENTVLLCCTSATIGNCAIARIPLVTNQQWNGLEIKEEYKECFLPEYIYIWAKTLKNKMLFEGGSNTFPFVSTTDLSHYLIPITSIEEQKRIVEIVESLLKLIKNISRSKKIIINDLLKLKTKIIDSVIFENETIQRIDKSKWTTLLNITNDSLLNDGNWILSEDMVQDGPVNLLQLGNIGDCCFKKTNYKHLSKEHFIELGCRQIYPGYLLINRLVADKMLSCIIPNIEGILITSVDACWVAPNEDVYNLKYIMYMLSSSYFQNEVKLKGKGVTRFRISKTNLISIPFPLPKKEKQDEIVEKIENAFVLIEKIIS